MKASSFHNQRESQGAQVSHLDRYNTNRPHYPLAKQAPAERLNDLLHNVLRSHSYAHPYNSSNVRAEAVIAWTDAYNTPRTHTGICGLTPWQPVTNLLGFEN